MGRLKLGRFADVEILEFSIVGNDPGHICETHGLNRFLQRLGSGINGIGRDEADNVVEANADQLKCKAVPFGDISNDQNDFVLGL